MKFKEFWIREIAAPAEEAGEFYTSLCLTRQKPQDGEVWADDPYLPIAPSDAILLEVDRHAYSNDGECGGFFLVGADGSQEVTPGSESDWVEQNRDAILTAIANPVLIWADTDRDAILAAIATERDAYAAEKAALAEQRAQEAAEKAAKQERRAKAEAIARALVAMEDLETLKWISENTFRCVTGEYTFPLQGYEGQEVDFLREEEIPLTGNGDGFFDQSETVYVYMTRDGRKAINFKHYQGATAIVKQKEEWLWKQALPAAKEILKKGFDSLEPYLEDLKRKQAEREIAIAEHQKEQAEKFARIHAEREKQEREEAEALAALRPRVHANLESLPALEWEIGEATYKVTGKVTYDSYERKAEERYVLRRFVTDFWYSRKGTKRPYTKETYLYEGSDFSALKQAIAASQPLASGKARPVLKKRK